MLVWRRFLFALGLRVLCLLAASPAVAADVAAAPANFAITDGKSSAIFQLDRGVLEEGHLIIPVSVNMPRATFERVMSAPDGTIVKVSVMGPDGMRDLSIELRDLL
jgi:hypothetical protein